MLGRILFFWTFAFLLPGSLLGSPYQLEVQNPSWFPTTECSSRFLAKKIDYKYRYGQKSPPEGYGQYYSRIQRASCFKDLTILIYMQADNNLSDYALMDLHEMEIGYESNPGLSKTLLAGSGLHTDVVAQVDTAGNFGRTRFHLNQTPEFKRRDEIAKIEDFRGRDLSVVKSPVVEVLPEVSGAQRQADDLRTFLNWGIRTYPARRYMVILWGHGKGWSNLAIARDEYPEVTAITVPEVRESLSQVQNEILEGKRAIDLYASDACLMQSLEVVTELADVTRFIHGSEQIQNFMGLPYRRLLYEINSGRFNGERLKVEGSAGGRTVPRSELDTPYLIARMIPGLLWQSLNPKQGSQGVPQPQANRSMTFSSFSSSELKRELIPAFFRFSERAVRYVESSPDANVRFLSVVKGAPRMDGGTIDVGAFLGLLLDALSQEEIEATSSEAGELPDNQTAIDLKEATQDLLAATSRAVVAKSYGDLYLMGPYGLGLFKSLSIWLPMFKAELIGETSRLASLRKSLFFIQQGSSSEVESNWEKLLKTLFLP